MLCNTWNHYNLCSVMHEIIRIYAVTHETIIIYTQWHMNPVYFILHSTWNISLCLIIDLNIAFFVSSETWSIVISNTWNITAYDQSYKYMVCNTLSITVLWSQKHETLQFVLGNRWKHIQVLLDNKWNTISWLCMVKTIHFS